MRWEQAFEIKKNLLEKRPIEKKLLIAILKGFIKQPVLSPTFLDFYFLIEYCMSVFSLSL